MTKRESFIKMVDNLLRGNVIDSESAEYNYDDAMVYLEALKNTKEKEKVPFTEKGKQILIFMQENREDFSNLFKAKEIAEGLGVQTRAVSGSMQKLVADQYVEKIGESPSSYSLTDSGINLNFN